MALAFTGLGAKFEATSYAGSPVVSGLSLSSGDLLIVTATVADIAGDQSAIGAGPPTLDSAWGTITDLGISSGSGYFGDPITQAWTVAVTSTGSSRSVTLPGGSDGSYGAFVGLTVAKVTGHNTSSPIGAKLSGTSTTNNLTTSTLTTTNANAYVYASGVDGGSASAPSSSDLTYTAYALASGSALVGWKSATTAGNYTANLDSAAAGSAAWGYVVLEVKIASSGTAYTASGTSTITATGTASLAKTLTGSATGTETATGTGSLTYTANAAASSSITATGTAAATKTVGITASATVTATGTAAASSTQALAATSSITGTGTAAASTTSPIAITATSSITASGTAALNLTYSATASSSITATGTAVLLQGLKVGATSTITASAAGAVGILATASTVTALASSPSVARINPNETRVSRA